MKTGSTKTVRCATYTRVSTDQGLEQDFNSLDAQYDASQAYIRSQAHAGWTLLRTKYDDGGFSGGNTDRPALQRLLEDVRAGKVDVIVVYKVDRLTRSLADFAKLVELFDKHSVSFVSVTQQFNTTTSMGRLTLNVLLSFAQFEREVTSERIRDKIAASKRKGLWVGGMAPIGYDTKDRKISVNEAKADWVRTIFRNYLKLGSLNLLMTDLRKRGIRSRRRQAVKPDAEQGEQRDEREKAVNRDQQRGRYPRRSRDRRRQTWIELTPDRGAETEHREEHQHAAVGEDQPIRHQAGEQGLRSDAARQR